MGIHLDIQTLWNMKRDVFGLGGMQFGVTAVAVAAIAGSGLFGLFEPQSLAAMVVLGGGLALSSSAFVLQLLKVKDGDQLESDHGKTSFGVLLLQDLAVVPLLVAIPLLAGGSSSGSGGGSLRDALTSAGLKAVMALGAIGMAGTFLLEPMFEFVTKC
eukprot:scaffold1278_cov50-Attheya_sp.AAC.1